MIVKKDNFMSKRIKLGIIGLGKRGWSLLSSIVANIPAFDVTYVCDGYEDRAKKGADKVKEVYGHEINFTTDYEEVLHSDVDAVIVSTSWETHVKIAISALQCKKAVGLEVGGAYNIEECYDLVKAQEESGTPFMLLENCCYGKAELLGTALARAGVLGAPVHLRGAYSHDLREEILYGNVNRHYRLRNYINRNCENYPTHEIGPIAKLIDINRGNRMVSLFSMSSRSMGLHEYLAENKDKVDKTLMDVEFKQGDIVNTLIKCENGETISIMLDTTLPGYYSRDFTVKGTKAMFSQDIYCVLKDEAEEMYDTPEIIEKFMNNAKDYEQEYMPPLWRDITKEQKQAGHGGMDYFCLLAFSKYLLEGGPSPIDVYDAASWMCITALSEQSIKTGKVVEIPDFTVGKYKTRERLDVVDFGYLKK